MGLGFTDSTQGMSMLGSGLMASAMAVEFILAKMGAAMLGSSSGVSSMEWVTTILGKFFFWFWILSIILCWKFGVYSICDLVGYLCFSYLMTGCGIG